MLTTCNRPRWPCSKVTQPIICFIWLTGIWNPFRKRGYLKKDSNLGMSTMKRKGCSRLKLSRMYFRNATQPRCRPTQACQPATRPCRCKPLLKIWKSKRTRLPAPRRFLPRPIGPKREWAAGPPLWRPLLMTINLSTQKTVRAVNQ